MKKLTNKVALVTGGSRGIGAAIVEHLAREGAHVIFTYLSSDEKANQVVKTAKAYGVQSMAIRADAAVPKAIIEAINQVATEFGTIDILVNNAGWASFAPFEEYSLDNFERTFAINVRSVFIASQEALKHMKDGGRIINIGSVNAERMPTFGGSAYAMSKSALIGLTKGMARDLGPRGITVNNIHPGPIDTDMNPQGRESANGQLSIMVMPHFGNGNDIAAMVAFVSSSDAGYITGANLTIDGGYTI